MAIGEHVVSSMWMNSAAISIEKLLDEILKVKKHYFLFEIIFNCVLLNIGNKKQQ